MASAESSAINTIVSYDKSIDRITTVGALSLRRSRVGSASDPTLLSANPESNLASQTE